MKGRDKGFVGVVLVVVFFFMLFLIVVRSIGIDEEVVEDGVPMALIEVSGVIMDSKEVIDQLHRAENHKEVKAIVLRINSPGGAVGPTQEIYHEIRRIDKKIPVYASFGTIAASGGYYIGAAARKIYANPGTLTGSIGVIMQFVDMSRLFQYLKVSPVTLKSGKFKDIGGPQRPLLKNEKKMMNRMLKIVHLQFIRDIESVRGKKIKGRNFAQGQIFSGEEALKLGLVDKLGGLWALGRDLVNDLGLKEKPQFISMKKKKRLRLLRMLDELESEVQSFFKFQQPTLLPMYRM